MTFTPSAIWKSSRRYAALALALACACPEVFAQTANYSRIRISTGPCLIRAGSGSPEGVVVGSVCDVFLRTNGGSGTTIYVKSSGTATNTGWSALASGGTAPTSATYIVQTADSTLSAEQALAALASGYAKITTTTGVVSSQAVPIPVADGGTNLTTATDDAAVVGNGTTWEAKVMPDCPDTGGNHFNYTASTNTFSCGTTGGGGGGSGNVTSTNTDASPPGSPASGDLFLPNNGVYLKRYSGSAWAPWGPIFPMTPPVDGDFAWINQGTASVDTTYGGIYLNVPAVGVSVNWKIRKKAAPSTPYTITAAILLDSLFEPGWQAGLCFRQSDGKLHVFAVQRYPAAPTSSAALLLNSLIYNSPTNYSAAYAQSPYMAGSLAWLRIADNGTSRITSFSHDGQHWRAFTTTARTTDITATEVGFCVDNENGTFTTGATLLSWKEQ